MARVAVVGPTTWGTTLAAHLASCGATVWLLARTEAEASALATAGRNARFLPDVPFPQDLAVTHKPSLALDGAEMLVIAVPSSSFRQNVQYTEGRKVKNSRRARAMEKGSRYGRQEQEQAWQSAEVDALHRLAAAGVRVPRQAEVHPEVSAFGTPATQTQAPRRSAPAVAQGAKVGRNDPCPCGSGKKYKKCHGA